MRIGTLNCLDSFLSHIRHELVLPGIVVHGEPLHILAANRDRGADWESAVLRIANPRHGGLPVRASVQGSIKCRPAAVYGGLIDNARRIA